MTVSAKRDVIKGGVTISASFGAHGDRIGHAVADRLGLAFLDRAIPTAVARQLHLSELSAERLDERPPSRWVRILRSLAAPGPIELSRETIDGLENYGFAAGEAAEPFVSAEGFRLATEKVLRQVADTQGAVILGRAGMVVLGGRPDVLCVRLDGPPEARIAQAITAGMDESTARTTQKDVDRAREHYVSSFYKVHADDMHLYHLVIDTTALPVDACVDIITSAAEARFASARALPPPC